MYKKSAPVADEAIAKVTINLTDGSPNYAKMQKYTEAKKKAQTAGFVVVANWGVEPVLGALIDYKTKEIIDGMQE